MGRLVAVARFIRVPAERSAIGHAHRHRLAAVRHARGVERRARDDVADRGEQAFLRGSIEVTGAEHAVGFKPICGPINPICVRGLVMDAPVKSAHDAVPDRYAALFSTLPGTRRSLFSASCAPEPPASWYSASSLTFHTS